MTRNRVFVCFDILSLLQYMLLLLCVLSIQVSEIQLVSGDISYTTNKPLGGCTEEGLSLDRSRMLQNRFRACKVVLQCSHSDSFRFF